MATYLFNDISEFKAVIGGAANLSLEFDSIGPTMLTAFQNHLLDWLGQEQWDELVDAVENDDATAEELALLPYVRRPLAMLTMYEYIAIGAIQFGEAGIHQLENTDVGMKTAYKYQINDYRQSMLHNGYEAMEIMIIFLNANKADYSTWSASEAFGRSRANFLNYAREFRAGYSKKISRYTFEILRGIIQDVELFALLDFLGQDQYDRLKEGILHNDDGDVEALTSDEKNLLAILQRAISLFAVEEGIRRNWVTIKGADVVQSETLEPQSYIRETAAGTVPVSTQLVHLQEFANRHLYYARKWLTDRLEAFPLYSAYLAALASAEEAEAEAEAEETCQCERCGRWPGYCTCTSNETPRGMVRL